MHVGSNPTDNANMLVQRRTLRCPNGYRFYVKLYNNTRTSSVESRSLPRESTTSIRVDLKKDHDVVGYVDLVWTRFGFWETHSFLDEEERGKNLGTIMYAKAIDVILRRNQRVKSSKSPSNYAKRVWTSRRLNQAYVISYRGGRFCVISKR